MLTQEINLFGGWQDGWDQSGTQASSPYPLPWADMANQSQHSLLSWGAYVSCIDRWVLYH